MRKGADREVNVFLAVEAVDGEEDLLAVLWEEVGFWVERRVDSAVGSSAGRDGDAGVDYPWDCLDLWKGIGEDALGEGAVHDNCVCEAGCCSFEPVEWDAVERLDEGLPRGQEVVGEVAVEEDLGARGEEAEERDAGGELVDEDVVVVGELGGGEERESEVDLAQDCAEDGEAAEDVWGNESVARDVDLEGAWRRWVSSDLSQRQSTVCTYSGQLQVCTYSRQLRAQSGSDLGGSGGL